jgi:hypothetical protein
MGELDEFQITESLESWLYICVASFRIRGRRSPFVFHKKMDFFQKSFSSRFTFHSLWKLGKKNI